MSKGWHEVARLGGAGARYPHILVDSHGWCLRMGANTRQDEKYYSSFPNLLQGLVEHFARRRLAATASMGSLKDLVGEVRDAMRAALELCHEALQRGGLEEHIRHVGGSTGQSTDQPSSRLRLVP